MNRLGVLIGMSLILVSGGLLEVGNDRHDAIYLGALVGGVVTGYNLGRIAA